MERMIVWTDASRVEQDCTEDFYLDLECGYVGMNDDPREGNRFSLQLPEAVRLEAGSVVFLEGTNLGGMVTGRVSDTAVDGYLQWEGRTWVGLLADKTLEPDAGQAYYTASGTDSACISALLAKLGLTGLFEAGDGTGGAVSYQYPRYKNGATSLFRMLESAGERPDFAIARSGGSVKVVVDAAAARTLDEMADGEFADVEISANLRPYNHVIGLGQGELTERDVVHRYADSSGNVSETQTFTGLAERTVVYENTSATHDDLVAGAVELLKELQGDGGVAVAPFEDVEAAIGDYMKAYDQRIDVSVTSMVSGFVVKVKDGVMERDWSAG